MENPTRKCRYDGAELKPVKAEGRSPNWHLAPFDSDKLEVAEVQLHACPTCGYSELVFVGVQKA